MTENAVIVVFYDKLAAILAMLEENNAVPISSFEEIQAAP